MYRQMETDKWRLVMNRNERRILVVEDILSPADKEDIKENDYEAVYIASCSGYDIDNVQTILSVHPLLEKKSGLKPIFVTDKLRGRLRMLAELIDGYADGPLAVSVTNKIEKIYGNMQEMNFSCRTIQAETEEERLVHAFRLMVSRKKYRLVPLLSPGSSSGYVMPFIEVVERMGLVRATSRKRFQTKLVELDYMRSVRFIHRVHLCPECQYSHILFIEVCPKCRSSDIRSQSVIHHFRCANVSPESTYQRDGKLVCPKCDQTLRHIGVDYDRPTDIYICGGCSHHFTLPDMDAVCTLCKESFKTSQLVPYDIYEYELTPEGIRAFTSGEIYRALRKEFVGLNPADRWTL